MFLGKEFGIDMQVSQIRIQSQTAQIQITQTKGKQEIQQPEAELSIQQPPAQVSINTTPSKLEIDQTKAWEDMNLMHIIRRNDQFAQEGMKGLLEGMGRRAEQGTALMKIENGSNPIANQAITNGHIQMKSLGITFIPSHFSVKTSYQPAEVNIDVQTIQPVIDATIRKVEHQYERGSVDISMKQYQQLEIDFV